MMSSRGSLRCLGLPCEETLRESLTYSAQRRLQEGQRAVAISEDIAEKMETASLLRSLVWTGDDGQNLK